jgi:DNA polymerase III delta subunit
MNKWDNVFVYTGDEFLSNMHFRSLVNSKDLIFFDNDADLKTIHKSLFTFNIFSEQRAYKIINPKAEILKIINDNIESLSTENLGIFAINDSLDLRSSFSKNCQKNKRIINIQPILVNDQNNLKKFLSNVNMTNEAFQFLLQNCPTETIKIKDNNIKKDAIVYNLYLLTNEINKLTSAFDRPLVLEDFNDCNFSNDENIFEFINDCFLGHATNILEGLDILNKSHGHQATLMILLSQLNFYFSISELKEKNLNIQEIDKLIKLEDFINKYFDKDYTEIKNINIPAPNPIRAKIAYHGFKNNTEELTNMYLSVVNSIIDLRNNVKENIVFPRLALALSNKVYIKSLTNGQL